jgi:translation elongation factor EF-Tu-like GTPase
MHITRNKTVIGMQTYVSNAIKGAAQLDQGLLVNENKSSGTGQ